MDYLVFVTASALLFEVLLTRCQLLSFSLSSASNVLYLDCATFPVKFLGYSIYVLLSPVNAVWTERELKSRH